MTKLLLVEDDAIIASIYQRKLKMEGFDVTHAEDGQVAIDTLKETAPEIVLLDLQLPKKNGVDVLQFIRGQESTSEIPVVVFTNAYLGTLVQAAWDAGATKCLTKAICTPKQVADVLRATLEGRDIGLGGRSQPQGGDPDGPLPEQSAAPVADTAPIPPTGALADLLKSASQPAASTPTSSEPIKMPDLGGLAESTPAPEGKEHPNSIAPISAGPSSPAHALDADTDDCEGRGGTREPDDSKRGTVSTGTPEIVRREPAAGAGLRAPETAAVHQK